MTAVTDPRIRKREIQVIPKSTRTAVLSVNGTTSSNTFTTGITGEETTTSWKGINWLAYRTLKKRARETGKALKNDELLSMMDLGHEFETVKKYVEHGRLPDVHVHASQGIYDYVYDGPWVAKEGLVDKNSSLYPAVPPDLRDRMITLGTTAIARTMPTNSVASAAQFLGELREGLPAVPGRHLVGNPGNLSSYSDEFLNYQFGVKPILSDLQKFAEAGRTANKVIAQLKRDSGRLVRRRYTFPVDRIVTAPVVQSTNWYGYPGLRVATPNAYSSGPGKLTKTREETYTYWFSGAYTYHYADGDRAVDKMRAAEQRLAKLFGVRVTPELLWELTPWSWAADWFANTGDVIHNLSAFGNDSLVMRWGYIMCHYTCRDTYLAEGVSLKGNASGPLTQTFVTDVKKRVKATPYGFGLDTGTFSERQWAILGALGISRGSRLL